MGKQLLPAEARADRALDTSRRAHQKSPDGTRKLPAAICQSSLCKLAAAYSESKSSSRLTVC